MMLQKLLHDKELLIKQQAWLSISYTQCHAIGCKDSYSVDEFGLFETLCSRYSRSIDFLVRKLFRTLDIYEFETPGTLVDVVNHAHKRGLFDDIELIRTMKDLRNTIVHEYIEDEMADMFDEVLEYTPKLLFIMQNSIDYIERITAKSTANE